VKEDLGDSFPIIEAGETQIGLESTVLDVTQNPFQLCRPGGVSRNQIENIIKDRIITAKTDLKNGKPKSPGMKYTHYTPEATVEWLDIKDGLNDKETLYLIHSNTFELQRENIIYFKED